MNIRKFLHTTLRLLPEYPVEYVYVSADPRDPNYSLGVCTRSEAISRVLRNFVANMPPGSGPSTHHSFAVHRSDCAAVQKTPGDSLPCGAEQDAFCWEGTALIERDTLPVPDGLDIGASIRD